MSHIDALNLRLSNERIRLTQAKTQKERALRSVWIAQVEKEIATEEQFAGHTEQLSDDDLLAELSA